MLDKIIAAKQNELSMVDLVGETTCLKDRASQLGPVTSLVRSLKDRSHPIGIIAEIKRRSPSKGLLNESINVEQLALAYEKAGATAVSVLTETQFFDGSLDDLKTAKAVLKIPVLRKDFIITEYQIWESCVAGADLLLLLACCLTADKLAELIDLSRTAGIEALVEVHTEAELELVLPLKPDLIAINNRNLKTFEVDLNRVKKLKPMIPENIPVISASGVFKRSEMIELAKLSVDAVLIGEALVTSSDPEKKMQELLGVSS